MKDIDEHQKVAALVCMDIDIVLKAAEKKPELALGLLRMLKDKKDAILNDKECRDSRYSATCTIFNIKKQ